MRSPPKKSVNSDRANSNKDVNEQTEGFDFFSNYIPKELQFIAERVINSNLRSGTADNDANAMKNMGMLPEGAVVNHFLTDTDAFFIKTDAPNGFKYFNRSPIKTAMEGDFDTGNMRFKARERYSFGVSDWRCVFGTPGA